MSELQQPAGSLELRRRPIRRPRPQGLPRRALRGYRLADLLGLPRTRTRRA